MASIDRLTIVRRVVQIAAFAFFLSIPTFGLLRLDLDSRRLVVLGQSIWAYEVYLFVIGMGVFLVVLAGLSLIGGRVFCGWLCPQTTIGELSAWLSRKGRQSQTRPWIGPALAWIALVVVAGLTSFLVVGFFVPSEAILGVVSGHYNSSLLKALVIVAAWMLVLTGFFKHNFCDWLCVIGWWQRIFAQRNSLRISFQAGHSGACRGCNACKANCIVGLEPRKRNLPSTCLNCTACVSACIRRSWTTGAPAPLRLARPLSSGNWRRDLALRGAAFVLILVAISVSLFLGSSTREPVQVQVAQAGTFRVSSEGLLQGQFSVEVYNNSSQSLEVLLTEAGLPAERVHLSPESLSIPPKQRAQANLAFALEHNQLSPGKHQLRITAKAVNGPLTAHSFDGHVTFGVPPLANFTKSERSDSG